MKVASILIASASAQQPRQRENKENDFGSYDSGFGVDADAFADAFGDYNFDTAGFDMSAFNDYGFGSTAAPTAPAATDAAADYSFDYGADASSDSDAAADYVATEAADYDGADDFGSDGRPEEEDEGKSNFVIDEANFDAEAANVNGLAGASNEFQVISSFDSEGAGTLQRCFVGSSGEDNAFDSAGASDREIKAVDSAIGYWFTNGVWDTCDGENDTCQIKVVRKRDRITQIVSKCANRHSCVDNMRQNFNPASILTGTEASIYHTWLQQSCRPQRDAQEQWNARQQSKDSVCFFCVNPCRDSDAFDGSMSNANAMREAQCVGRSGPVGSAPSAADDDGDFHPVWNASPIATKSVKLFQDCNNAGETDDTAAANAIKDCVSTVESDHGQEIWNPSYPGSDMRKLNFYSVLEVTLKNTEIDTAHPMTLTQEISQIQFEQIKHANLDGAAGSPADGSFDVQAN